MSALQLLEFDAAQALLDLSVCPNNRGNNHQEGGGHNEEVVESAKLFLSCILITDNNKTNQVPTPPPPPPSVAAAAVPRVRTIKPIFVLPKTDASEPSEQPSPSTSTGLSKRKSPDQELPRDPRVNAYHDQQTSKRTKLFKGKPIIHYTVVSSPITQTLKKNDQPQNDASSSNFNVGEVKVNDKTKVQIKSQPVKDEQQPSSSGLSNIKKQTRDVATQTDDMPQLLELETMDSTISKLCDKIKSLKAEINSNSQLMKMHHDTSDDDDDDDNDESYSPNTTSTTTSGMNDSITEGTNRATRAKNKAGPNRSRVKSTRVLTEPPIQTNTMNGDDMVSIGYGNTMVPARIYRHINWNSYTTATRKLLTAVFSRKVLATHSLTGKPSPAFLSKPPKAQLDPTIVEDIVHTVVDKCRVPESVVRTSITTKCADESKMYRTRQENKKKRKPKVDRENIPPDSESD